MWQQTALGRAIEEHGSFLRREALANGFDDKAIRRAVRSGEWVRVRHGSYTVAALWPEEPVDQHVLRTRAAVRTLGPVAASHQSAAALHGMDLWEVPLDQVHVTRLDNGAGRTEHDLTHHESLCLADELTKVRGVTTTRPVRAALETASLVDVERGLVVVDSGLRAGLFTEEELAAQHDAMVRWPDSQHLHLVTRLADGRSQSVGETRSRFLFWSQGLPEPELQYEVYDDDGRLVGTTDFAWPEFGLLGEFDGKMKYQRYLRDGEPPGDAVFREKKREDDLRRITGWGMVRFIWADLYDGRRTASYVRALMRPAA
jgi:hypothetical protein